MTKTRATLRLEIKEILREFPDTDTIATGGIDSSAAVLPVSNIDRYAAGSLLYIESEIMIVRSIDSANSQLTVTRAFQGSTAAAHVATTAIQIVSEFTDRALNQAANYAIADCWPEIYFVRSDSTLSTLSTTREYSVPSAFTARAIIATLEIEDGNGNYQINKEWKLIGGIGSGGTSNQKIVFNKPFTEDGLIIRVTGQDYQPLLSDDSTNLVISDEQSTFVVYSGAKHALDMRLGHRIKATEYSASVNDRAGQPNDMMSAFGYFKRQSEFIRARERRQPLGGYLTTPKR